MRLLALLILLILIDDLAFGAELHVDAFEDGTTLGWSGASPMVISTGGPAGADDSFLQVVSHGAGGPGSRSAAFNQAPGWVGDFAATGATSIEFDMANFTTSASPLDMRVVLFGPASTGNRFTSIESQTIPNDGVWRRYSFSLAESELMGVQGAATYDDLITNVVRVMFRHDAGGPSPVGTPIAATIGVDNIALVGDVGLLCDLDVDGSCDSVDIDLLMNAVAAGSNEAQFDLNADGGVDDLDRNDWLASAGPENGFSDSYLVGDANLDGSVDAQDLNALALTWQTANAMWTDGNFTGADTNVADLNALALNWQQSVAEAAPSAAIPEPCGLWLLVLAIASITIAWRPFACPA